MPKAAWSITKGIEKVDAKNVKRVHEKRMRKIRSGTPVNRAPLCDKKDLDA